MQNLQKLRETVSNFVKSASKWSEEKFDSAISNGKCQKLRDSSPSKERRRFNLNFNEYTFLIGTVLFSTSIVIFKILFANRDNFRKVYAYGKRLLSTPFSLAEFNFLPQLWTAFVYLWSIFVDLNWLFIPAIVGIATTFITWRCVYWDSRIPGIMPPSPFSPKLQNRIPSLAGASGYTFAMYIGIFVFFILVVWGVVSS